MKRLGSICARGGSKGVSSKNTRVVAGKPLIAHTIHQALSSKLFDCISVSSDSDEILNIAKQFGANVVIKRPDELATDNIAKLFVIQHCMLETEKLINIKFDTIVDMDCTSPLRSINDIIESIKLFESTKEASNLITGTRARRSPYFNMVAKKNNGFVELAARSENPIVRRQDAPDCYDMNASIYIWSRESLLSLNKVISEKTIIYEMPEERSLDIDSNFDFEFVSYLLERRNYE